MANNPDNGSAVERQLTRLVVPFWYGLNYEQAEEALSGVKLINKKGDAIPVWKRGTIAANHLFQNISRLIDSSNTNDEHNETIGKRFVFETTARLKFGLPNSISTMMTLKIKESKQALVTVSGIELYLFETQVGMVVLELKHPEHCTVEQLIETNYYCKKLNIDTALSFYPKGPDGEPAEVKLNEICLKLVNELGPVEFFEKDKEEKAVQANNVPEESDNLKILPKPSNALVYSAVLLDAGFTGRPGWPELLKQYLFRLRRSYKESYKPAEKEFRLESNPEIAQMFENSFWGVSLEGMTNLLHLVDDAQTNAFMRGNYFGNLSGTYFFLYILAIHQRYALLRFAIEASQLPKSKHLGSQQIAEMRQRIANFSFRCLFRQVSNITHQAKLYNMLRQVLGIEDLMEELHYELEVLSSLAESDQNKRRMLLKEQEEKEKEAEAKEKDALDKQDNYFKSMFTVLTAIFIGLNTSSTVYGFFKNEVRPLIPHYYLYVLALSIIAIWLGVSYPTLRFLRHLQRARKPGKRSETSASLPQQFQQDRGLHF